MIPFDISKPETPCYVVDAGLLENNLKILHDVKIKAGCKVLLAQKAFSMFHFYPLIGRYLDGSAASGLYEAVLGREEMGGEVHVFSPAFTEKEFSDVLKTADHIIFNSIGQWQRFAAAAQQSGKSFGIRINPEHSTQQHGIYDPCSPGSRLGVTLAAFPDKLPDGIDGLHFHTLCEQNADALAATLDVVITKFGHLLKQAKWINLGGGHHITRPDYDRDLLISCIKNLKEKFGLEVYIEPGEAIALNAGFLVAEVIDFVENTGVTNAILDASAACHMPDVIEMPYRPPVVGSGDAGEKKYTYRFGGPTCLAGDVIGDYSFDEPMKTGDRVVFGDMAIYTMVKNNTFNGMPLPAIYAFDDGRLTLIKKFGYSDFKNRLS